MVLYIILGRRIHLTSIQSLHLLFHLLKLVLAIISLLLLVPHDKFIISKMYDNYYI